MEWSQQASLSAHYRRNRDARQSIAATSIIVTGSNSGIGKEAAQNLATSDEVSKTSGNYFYKAEEREIDIPDQASGATKKLWQIAEKQTGINMSLSLQF